MLEASIAAGLPYVDVCDEPVLCKASKKLHQRAMVAGVPCVTGAGIWPGSSALLVAEAVAQVRRLEGAALAVPCAGEAVEMSFFTARSQTVRKIIVQTVILKKSMGKKRQKSKIFFQIK